jgi:hypothetical protein
MKIVILSFANLVFFIHIGINRAEAVNFLAFSDKKTGIYII